MRQIDAESTTVLSKIMVAYKMNNEILQHMPVLMVCLTISFQSWTARIRKNPESMHRVLITWFQRADVAKIDILEGGAGGKGVN